MSIESSFLWKITKLFLILGTISYSEQEDHSKPDDVTCQKYFQKISRGGEISNGNDVLSNNAVTSSLLCGELCLQEPSCTGFNYMIEGNQSQVNCQITDTLYKNIDMMNGAATWEFYQSIQTIQTCPNGWLQLLSSCYYVSKNTTNHSNALSSCRSMGADLFLPLTEEETLTVKRATAHHKYWIGLKLDPRTKKFYTTTGQLPSYTKWRAGEPNNLPWENCVQFIVNKAKKRNWNNVPCSMAYRYICQIRC